MCTDLNAMVAKIHLSILLPFSLVNGHYLSSEDRRFPFSFRLDCGSFIVLYHLHKMISAVLVFPKSNTFIIGSI